MNALSSARVNSVVRFLSQTMLFVRLYGKAKEKVKLTGKDGKDLNLMPTVNIIIKPPPSSQQGLGLTSQATEILYGGAAGGGLE